MGLRHDYTVVGYDHDILVLRSPKDKYSKYSIPCIHPKPEAPQPLNPQTPSP